MAQGDILYRGASAWKRLVAGTSGKFLKTQGAAADPIWDTPSGTGNVTTSATLTANKAIIGNGTTDVTVSAVTGIGHLASGTLTGSNVVESEITLADNTTNNVSTSAHGFAPKGDGSTTKFLNANGAYATVSGASVVVQVVNTLTGAVASGSTTIPLDDTIPQKTEGNEYMTLAITPTSSTNKLRIDVVFFGSTSVAAELTIALFQDTTTDALAATSMTIFTSTARGVVTLTHYMTAGTTSATTFKIRAGSNAGATVTFNGLSATRLYGGVAASSITITEIVP